LRFFLLLGAIVWAGSANLTRPLRVYFYAEFFGTLLTEAFLLLYGKHSPEFAWSYVCALVLILVASLWVTVDANPSVLAALTGIALGTLVGVLAYREGLHPYRSLYVAEGAIRACCGVILLINAPLRGWPKVTITLGFLWLALGTFRLGFLLHESSPIWQKMNWVFPSWIVICAFLLVGAFARSPSLRQ